MTQAVSARLQEPTRMPEAFGGIDGRMPTQSRSSSRVSRGERDPFFRVLKDARSKVTVLDESRKVSRSASKSVRNDASKTSPNTKSEVESDPKAKAAQTTQESSASKTADVEVAGRNKAEQNAATTSTPVGPVRKGEEVVEGAAIGVESVDLVTDEDTDLRPDDVLAALLIGSDEGELIDGEEIQGPERPGDETKSNDATANTTTNATVSQAQMQSQLSSQLPNQIQASVDGLQQANAASLVGAGGVEAGLKKPLYGVSSTGQSVSEASLEAELGESGDATAVLGEVAKSANAKNESGSEGNSDDPDSKAGFKLDSKADSEANSEANSGLFETKPDELKLADAKVSSRAELEAKLTELKPVMVESRPTKAEVQPPAQAMTNEAKFAEQNVDRMVQSVRTIVTQRGGEMQLKLDPPELGVLQVSLKMTDGVMSATFTTENAQATQALSHSLQQLKNSLEGAGISVDRIQVRQSSESNSASSNNSQQGQDGSQQQRGFEQGQQHREDRREQVRQMWRRISMGEVPVDMVA